MDITHILIYLHNESYLGCTQSRLIPKTTPALWTVKSESAQLWQVIFWLTAETKDHRAMYLYTLQLKTISRVLQCSKSDTIFARKFRISSEHGR